MKEIKSNVIGKLEQDDQFKNWWVSEPIEIPFWTNSELKITFMDFEPELDKEFIGEADEALKTFLLKGEPERLQLTELVYKNCMDFLKAVEYDEMDKPMWDIENKHDIWKFVHPQDIYLTRRPRRDRDIYVNLTCECDWEQEHGLQLVFRRGKQLTRISDQDGHLTEADAYNKPDEEDALLCKFME